MRFSLTEEWIGVIGLRYSWFDCDSLWCRLSMSGLSGYIAEKFSIEIFISPLVWDATNLM